MARVSKNTISMPLWLLNCLSTMYRILLIYLFYCMVARWSVSEPEAIWRQFSCFSRCIFILLCSLSKQFKFQSVINGCCSKNKMWNLQTYLKSKYYTKFSLETRAKQSVRFV
jgi:hypothetical protein